MDLLSSFQNLWTNVKNVTLPGVFAALAFVLILWPPPTFDRIPMARDNHPDIAKLRIETRQWLLQATEQSEIKKDDASGRSEDKQPEPAIDKHATDKLLEDKNLDAYLKISGAACTIKEGADSYDFLTIPYLANRASVAVKNQLLLDDLDRTFNKCVEEETALQGIDDGLIADVNTQVATRTAERDGINVNLQRYINSLSPMQGEFQRLLTEKERVIAELQTFALNLQHIQKERVRRIAELTRLDAEIKLRLADPGRLRPRQRFDDILSGLGSHILGFLTLVVGWGLLVEPVNRAVFSFFYDNSFKEIWDNVRPDRDTPGQDAETEYKLRMAPIAKSEAPINPENKGELNSEEEKKSLTATKKRKTFFARMREWRTQPRPSFRIVSLFLILAGLLIWLWNPEAKEQRSTAINVCPGQAAIPQIPFSGLVANVVAPGSAEAPTGKVDFVDHADVQGKDTGKVLDTENLDSSGRAVYAASSLGDGPHKITAKYSFLPAEEEKKERPFQESLSSPLRFDGEMPLEDQDCTSMAAPDLTHPVAVKFWPLLGKCLILLILAFVIALFLPGVLKSIASGDQGQPGDDKTAAAAKQTGEANLVENLANDLVHKLTSKPGSTTEQKRADEYLKDLAEDLASKLKGNKAPTPQEKTLAKELVQQLVNELKKEHASGDQKAANELVAGLAKKLVKRLVSSVSASAPDPCKDKLAKDWPKLSQPAYAIGQNLMARSDFEALQNSYYSQSLISFGLILPMFFLTFAITVTPQFGLEGWRLYWLLLIVEVLLVITGVDRRHKYLTELDGLISGAFLKLCSAQNAKPAADPSSKTIAKQIDDALKAASIMGQTTLKIVPGDPSAAAATTKPATPTASTQPATPSTQPAAPVSPAPQSTDDEGELE